MKILLILSFLFFITLSLFKFLEADRGNVSLCERNTSEVSSCPGDLGRLFLPRTFSARAIYAGFSSDNIQVEFLELLIAEISKIDIKPKLNVLISNFEKEDAYSVLKKYFDNPLYDFINIIPTNSKDTIWAQDYFEVLFNTKTMKSEIVDLPYYDREGEDIPASIALVCQKELISQEEYRDDFKPGSGDYGGNIEPVSTKVLTVGSNLSNETFDILKSITTQEIVELNVDWLETGHVDELITTLPLKKNSAPCEQSLLVSSPQLAMNLINGSLPAKDELKNPHKPYSDEFDTWIDHYHCLDIKNKKNEECLELFRANKVYQRLIDIGVASLQDLMVKQHGCRLKEEKFPQLFIPLQKMETYGGFDDRAISLNPNSVNNIFFYPNLLLAKQSYPLFQKVVDTVLKRYPYKTIYIDDKFAHELNGGIHCATNISYSCSE